MSFKVEIPTLNAHEVYTLTFEYEFTDEESDIIQLIVGDLTLETTDRRVVFTTTSPVNYIESNVKLQNLNLYEGYYESDDQGGEYTQESYLIGKTEVIDGTIQCVKSPKIISQTKNPNMALDDIFQMHSTSSSGSSYDKETQTISITNTARATSVTFQFQPQKWGYGNYQNLCIEFDVVKVEKVKDGENPHFVLADNTSPKGGSKTNTYLYEGDHVKICFMSNAIEDGRSSIIRLAVNGGTGGINRTVTITNFTMYCIKSDYSDAGTYDCCEIKTPDDLELHELNGVADKLDLTTGIVTKHIGKNNGQLYVLSNPITEQLDIPPLKLYKNGSITTSSQQLTPTLITTLPISNKFTQTNLKSGTTYNIYFDGTATKLNCGGTIIDNPISPCEVRCGGTTLTIEGEVDNVRVLETSVKNEVGSVSGTTDVVLSKIKTKCNLHNYFDEYERTTVDFEIDYDCSSVRDDNRVKIVGKSSLNYAGYGHPNLSYGTYKFHCKVKVSKIGDEYRVLFHANPNGVANDSNGFASPRTVSTQLVEEINYVGYFRWANKALFYTYYNGQEIEYYDISLIKLSDEDITGTDTSAINYSQTISDLEQPIKLRSLGTTYDSYNLKTGELVKRIGVSETDGSYSVLSSPIVVKSVPKIIKGNVALMNTVACYNGASKSGDTITLNKGQTNSLAQITGANTIIQAGVKYLCILHDVVGSMDNVILSVQHEGSVENINFDSNNRAIFTAITPSTTSRWVFVINTKASAGTVSFKWSIIEYQDGMENWDIPYFSDYGEKEVQAPLMNNIPYLYKDGQVKVYSDSEVYPTTILNGQSTNNYEINELNTSNNYTIRYEGECESINLANKSNTQGHNVIVKAGATSGNLTFVNDNGYINNVMLVQNDVREQEINHFNGLQTVEVSKMLIQNCNNMFDMDNCDSYPQAGHYADVITREFIPVLPNETIYCNYTKGTYAYSYLIEYDENKTEILRTYYGHHAFCQAVITLKDNTRYIRITGRDGFLDQIMVNRGTGYLPYEKCKSPYQGVYIDLPQPVQLNSLPNGTCDTYNPITGEYVQNVGRYKVTSSRDSIINFFNRQKAVELWLRVPNLNRGGTDEPISNNFYHDWYLRSDCKPFAFRMTNDTDIDFGLPLEYSTIEKINEWFENNPTYIYYSINPITTQLTPINIPTFEGGILQLITTDGKVFPMVEYSLHTTNRYDTSTWETGVVYTQRNMTEVYFNDSTTPMISTETMVLTKDHISSGSIILNDNGNGLVVLKGNYTGRDIPYFTGMRSVEAIEVESISSDSTMSTTIQLPPHIQLHSLPDGTRDEIDLETGILVRRTQKINNEIVALEQSTTEKLILNYNNSCDYGRILPTGMCDKYDVVNSIYTQTMTSILLDGENTWDAMEEMSNVVKFTATGTTVGVGELNMLGAGGLYCDNDLFPNINDDSDVEHCRVDEVGNKFYIYIDKDRLMSPDLIGWQIWLQSNPFNLIYELEEHITYSKPYEELDPEQARWQVMDCMRDGTIRYHSNSSDNVAVYPTLEYVAPSINNFELTMLEPNTDYTVYAEGINENDTINFGGTDIKFSDGKVFTSGDNQWLRIDGNDSFYNMVITKGDTTGESVPYFKGMISVENPKVQCGDSTVSYADLKLRSLPNGVKDTINVITGEYVQRVGERKYQDGDFENENVLTNCIDTYYELAEPITTKLDPQTLLAFTDGTINLSSDTGLLPTTHYTVPSTNTFNLPSMKTGTRYTLKYPSASGSINIGNITYKISSDSMLFTTPLSITGDKSAIVFTDANPENVILIEGVYNTREVPYFTGVKSVKNPIITVVNNLTGESVNYQCTTNVELRGLPNGVADSLDIVKGKLTKVVGVRDYQEGDENLANVWTDGYETIYALSSPVVSNVTFTTPNITTNSSINLSSENLIPQLNYRAKSSNNFPLDLLQPNSTYTLYADTLVDGTYTLGGTHTGTFTGTRTITLGDITDNLLTFNGDLGLSNVMLVKGNSLKTTLPKYFSGLKSVSNASFLIEGMNGETNELVMDDNIVLRDCNGVKDVIDLITCTLTKRTGEIVLNGSENWIIYDTQQVNEDYILFRLVFTGIKNSQATPLICDKFSHNYLNNSSHNKEAIYSENNQLILCVKKTTIGGDTINNLKSWLVQNPTTIIYPLQTPIEVPLENIWTVTPPTSYDNRTQISTTTNDSLKPMLSVTVATTTLEEIVSNLESRNNELEEENIATMLALTSIYEIFTPTTINEGVDTLNLSDGKDGNNINGMSVSPMGMVYVKLIRKGLRTIEQVPTNLQAEVKYALKGLE